MVLLLRGISSSNVPLKHYLLLRLLHRIINYFIPLPIHNLNKSTLIGFGLRNGIVCSLSLAGIGTRCTG